MNHPFFIQIHNRTRFEKGEPGEWLTLPATAEQLQETMRRVGITAENSQDFFINGIQSSIAAVARLSLGNVQAAGIDELNYLAAQIAPLDRAAIEKLNAAGEIMAYWDSVHHLTEYTHNTDFFVYIPDVKNHAELGEYYLKKSQMIQMPEEWKPAVDVEQLGQLAALHEKGMFTEQGYILESGDEWQPVQEVPEQYRIMSYPEPVRDFDAIAHPDIATMPSELAAEPQPVIPIVLDSEKPADKLKEITDKLESGIAAIFNSQQYADYLKTLSKFHNYSFNNTILIAMQKPDASLIAGFNTWKKEFERNVMKGQKGIKIIAPSPFKVKKEMDKIDPDTQKPVIGKDGKPETEEVEVKIPAFKVVSVFDVSQTEGKELPSLGADILTGDVEQYNDFYAALEKASPVPVAFEEISSGANGYYSLEDKRIALQENMSELQTLKTAIHEIAHARLHDIDLNAPADEQNRVDRRTREVQAESIAYTVCQHYGLDTSDYSFGYVAGWSSGKELAELKASLETIRTTAAELIGEIDGHFAELQKNREAEQQRPVFENLPPEQQQALSDTVKDTLHFFIDSDLKERGELSDGTKEAIAVQGYEYNNGQLVKAEEPEKTQPLQADTGSTALDTPEKFAEDFTRTMEAFYKVHPSFLETAQMANTSPSYVTEEVEVGYPMLILDGLSDMEQYPEYKDIALAFRERLENFLPKQQEQDAPEQQPGTDEWSEPATPDNAPENPGVPSDDISAYLPQQDEQPAPDSDAEQTADAPETAITYYAINEQSARRAKEMNSFSDYRPGSATAEYRQMVDEAVSVAERQKKRVDPMHHEKIDRLVNTYARKLAENMNNSFAIDARVPSVLIAGPSKFPTRAKEKQNAARDRNMQQWRDIGGLLDKIRSVGMGGISADDPNAIDKLQEKLSGLEQSQETMKAANTYYRKHKTLDGCPVLSAEQIQKLTASMSNRWYGRPATQPFEGYALQNNNAEIHRVKARIEELTHREEAVLTGWEFEGGKVAVNKEDNRLQVFFDGKPDADTRAELKSNGFRWAPSVGAWQRQLNANAFYAANSVKSIQPLTGEKPTDLQRRAAREAKQQEQPPQQQDTYSIYQLKQGEDTRELRFESFERIQSLGIVVNRANYDLVYTAPISADTAELEQIFQKFNIDHPEDFTGLSLSMSDVIILNTDGKETAHYVDRYGFQEVPEFLQVAPPLDMQQTAAEPTAPDNFVTGEKIETPRGRFSLTDRTPAQMEAAGYGFHHSSDDGKYNIMGNGTRAFAVINEDNPLRTAEMSTEQNYNMIDSIMNNTPTVDELEEKVKAGEQISLCDLAAALKADKETSVHGEDTKPSIREQLKAAKEQTQNVKPTPDKAKNINNDLEV